MANRKSENKQKNTPAGKAAGGFFAEIFAEIEKIGCNCQENAV